MSFLNRIDSPKDLKKLKPEELPPLCQEIRDFLIETIQKTGGHLGASLGTVELTVALHYLLNSPQDKLVWDVSHQSYTHKILTGRRDRMKTLRQKDGLSGFTDPQESEHDFFKTGHASTAIAQAFGLVVARDFDGGDEKIVAIVGDGALSGGLAYEALNNAGHTKRDLLIILNDNEMSISPNVGAMSQYFNSIQTNPLYNRIRKQVEQATKNMPRLHRLIKNAEEGFKNLIVPGLLFEELGFRYFGPVDGHNVRGLTKSLKRVLSLKGPRIIHVISKKGMGCDLADEDPERLHGVTARKAESPKVEASQRNGTTNRSYTGIFAENLMKFAEKDSRIVAITAAMPSGTGLTAFQKKFPKRFFDVGIAEGYAVTFAGALAKGGRKPVCALYSSFLQRGVDQMIHDVALQGQNVIFAIDRAGVVGEDGPTHHGLFDIGLIRSIPESVIACPKDSIEMGRMLELGLKAKGIYALRYPRAKVPQEFPASSSKFEIGEGEVLRQGSDVTILTLGCFVSTALLTAERLQAEGISAGVINMRFVKPLDKNLLEMAAQKSHLIVTLEEHVLSNGFGTACLETFSELGLANTQIIRMGFPDQFMPHAKREELLEMAGLTPEKIALGIIKEGRLCKK
jgi:1-deoxy-D-xylulose-5-phosphate synthase